MTGLLAGLTFLNTRGSLTAGKLTGLLEKEGATVIERPAIAFIPPIDWAPFDSALEALQPGEWVLFSSATAVHFTLERLPQIDEGTSRLRSGRLAAVGAATAGALNAAGFAVDLVPEHFQAEPLLEALLPHLAPGDRVWQPRAAEARAVLQVGLAAAGVTLIVTPVYRTVMPPGGLGAALEPLRRGEVDWLVFTSESTVSHFREMLPDDLPPGGLTARVACLGAVTAETARQAGFEVAVVPERQDLEGLISAILAHLRAATTPGLAPEAQGG